MFRHLKNTIVFSIHAGTVVAAVLVPLYAVAQALWTSSGAGTPGRVTVAERWGTLLANTGAVCGVAAGTALSLGTIYALLLIRTDLPLRRVLHGAACLAACVPIYISVVFISSACPLTRLPASAPLCGLLYGLLYAPLATVLLAAAGRTIDRQLEELARLDGWPAQVLWRATLPQLLWAIAVVGILVTLLVATDYTITDLLRVRTFAEEAYTQYQLNPVHGGPLLTGAPLMVLLVVLFILLPANFRHLGQTPIESPGGSSFVFSLGSWRWPIGIVATGIPLVLIGGPTWMVLARIGTLGRFRTEAAKMMPELFDSALLSIISATGIVALAMGLAWAVVRRRRGRVLILPVMMLLLATPAPVVGISLIGLLNRDCGSWLGLSWPAAIYDSPAVLVLGYLVRFLPVGVLLLLPAVQRVPIEREWAMRVDGGDWTAIQRHLYWPSAWRPALAAWLVVVILCFGEIGMTMLLAPPGWETVAVRSFTLIHYGVYADLAVLAVMTVGCIAVPVGVLIGLLRWKVGQ